MDYHIREYIPDDLTSILSIYNYYALKSFAVYRDHTIPEETLANMMAEKKLRLVLTCNETVIGYGALGEYKALPNFSHTAVLAYFILPEHTGKGLGELLLNALLEAGKSSGINNFLVHICSKNTQSLNFHQKMGFVEAGRLKNVAVKFNEPIDIIWMQKQM
jgi:phosphinothricin acetyltransferase